MKDLSSLPGRRDRSGALSIEAPAMPSQGPGSTVGASLVSFFLRARSRPAAEGRASNDASSFHRCAEDCPRPPPQLQGFHPAPTTQPKARHPLQPLHPARASCFLRSTTNAGTDTIDPALSRHWIPPSSPAGPVFRTVNAGPSGSRHCWLSGSSRSSCSVYGLIQPPRRCRPPRP